MENTLSGNENQLQSQQEEKCKENAKSDPKKYLWYLIIDRFKKLPPAIKGVLIFIVCVILLLKFGIPFINKSLIDYDDLIERFNKLPMLTTDSVTNITDTSAFLVGNITRKGYPAYTERGVCITQYPLNTTKQYTITGTGKGSFIVDVSGLNPNTTYDVCTYATNKKGMVYGKQIRFTTLLPEITYLKRNTSLTTDTINMDGSVSLVLSDGTFMQLEGDEVVFRNLKLVTIERMTYNILNSYPSGTKFRINLTSSQSAYVYAFSTDSKNSSVTQLFPDPNRNISALLDFKSEVISIPDKTQYIQLDETPGEDYLCVIYSKEELKIKTVINLLQNNTRKSFVEAVNEILADKMVEAKEVKFEKNKIAFKATSANHTVVPIFIKIKHK